MKPKRSIRAFPKSTAVFRYPKAKEGLAAWLIDDGNFLNPPELTYEVKTISPEMFGSTQRGVVGECRVTTSDPGDVRAPEMFLDPEMVTRVVVTNAEAEMARWLEREGYVLDASGEVEYLVTLEVNVRATARCWPAIPGITVEEGK